MEQIRICISPECTVGSRIINNLDDADKHEMHKYLRYSAFQSEVQSIFSNCKFDQQPEFYDQPVQHITSCAQSLTQIVEELQIDVDTYRELSTQQQEYQFIINSINEASLAELTKNRLDKVVYLIQNGIDRTTQYWATTYQQVHESLGRNIVKARQIALELYIKNREDPIQQLLDIISKKDVEISQLQFQLKPYTDLNIRWSELKHNRIEMINDKVLRCEGAGWDCAAWFALAQPMIKQQDMPFRVRVRFAQLNNDVAIGICHRTIIHKQKYQSTDQYDKIGHGFYMLNSKGRIYSHSDQKLNNTKKGFQYDINEVLTLIYDGAKGVLSISNAIEEIQLQVQLSDDLYFAVQLTEKHDQIEILQ